MRLFCTCQSSLRTRRVSLGPFATPSGGPDARAEKLCSAAFLCQFVSRANCCVAGRRSEVRARATDDRSHQTAVTSPVHLCDCWHGGNQLLSNLEGRVGLTGFIKVIFLSILLATSWRPKKRDSFESSPGILTSWTAARDISPPFDSVSALQLLMSVIIMHPKHNLETVAVR